MVSENSFQRYVFFSLSLYVHKALLYFFLVSLTLESTYRPPLFGISGKKALLALAATRAFLPSFAIYPLAYFSTNIPRALFSSDRQIFTAPQILQYTFFSLALTFSLCDSTFILYIFQQLGHQFFDKVYKGPRWSCWSW